MNLSATYEGSGRQWATDGKHVLGGACSLVYSAWTGWFPICKQSEAGDGEEDHTHTQSLESYTQALISPTVGFLLLLGT